MKLGHEMHKDSCDPAVGAFEIGLSAEAAYKIGAMTIGFSLVIGCHENSYVTSDIRFNTAVGLSVPPPEGSAASGSACPSLATPRHKVWSRSESPFATTDHHESQTGCCRLSLPRRRRCTRDVWRARVCLTPTTTR